MDCSIPGFPILHHLPEFAQTYIHWVADAIQPSHTLSPFHLLPSIFCRIRVFPNESALCIRQPNYWSFSFSIRSFNKCSELISFRIDWLDLLAVQGTLESSATQFESVNSSALSLFYGPALTSLHDYWKNHSFDYTSCSPWLRAALLTPACHCPHSAFSLFVWDCVSLFI